MIITAGKNIHNSACMHLHTHNGKKSQCAFPLYALNFAFQLRKNSQTYNRIFNNNVYRISLKVNCKSTVCHVQSRLGSLNLLCCVQTIVLLIQQIVFGNVFILHFIHLAGLKDPCTVGPCISRANQRESYFTLLMQFIFLKGNSTDISKCYLIDFYHN